MPKRRTAEQIQRVLREADRDLATGLTIGDVCRKLGISQNGSESIGQGGAGPAARSAAIHRLLTVGRSPRVRRPSTVC